MSISSEQMRSTKTRPYQMNRRAEQVDQTRERITAAAVRLHTTVGPSNTSIAAVAEEAGVTRLTVYRHFADLDALFDACRGHWRAANPAPDDLESRRRSRDRLDRHRDLFLHSRTSVEQRCTVNASIADVNIE